MADYNPANFANRPQEEVEEIARKGGQSSHSSGFASMDPDKQVCRLSLFSLILAAVLYIIIGVTLFDTR